MMRPREALDEMEARNAMIEPAQQTQREAEEGDEGGSNIANIVGPFEIGAVFSGAMLNIG